MRYETRKYLVQNPDLENGYTKVFKVILIYGNIPWIIMALGDLTGYTDNILDYFNPRLFNPFVLLFHFSIIMIWILLLRWIYFKDGANFLIQHPGLVRVRGLGDSFQLTPKFIKIFFTLAVIGGIAGMIAMWIIDFPTFPAK